MKKLFKKILIIFILFSQITITFPPLYYTYAIFCPNLFTWSSSRWRSLIVNFH